MKMLPWYRIKMTRTKCGATEAIYKGTAADEYWSHIWNIIRSQGPTPCLQIRTGIGMPIVGPYPGKEPDYDCT